MKALLRISVIPFEGVVLSCISGLLREDISLQKRQMLGKSNPFDMLLSLFFLISRNVIPGKIRFKRRAR